MGKIRLITVSAVAGAIVSNALIFGGQKFFANPVQVIVHVQWRPAFCATFPSADNIPLAVCNEKFYPVYDIPEGYVGLLRDCVVSGRIRDCKPAAL